MSQAQYNLHKKITYLVAFIYTQGWEIKHNVNTMLTFVWYLGGNRTWSGPKQKNFDPGVGGQDMLKCLIWDTIGH